MINTFSKIIIFNNSIFIDGTEKCSVKCCNRHAGVSKKGLTN
jgi:hypothetical protein